MRRRRGQVTGDLAACSQCASTNWLVLQTDEVMRADMDSCTCRVLVLTVVMLMDYRMAQPRPEKEKLRRTIENYARKRKRTRNCRNKMIPNEINYLSIKMLS